ncbi:MAG TPA: LLM class flavin-dependent oxidoreductase, partial [Acidimicrobiales bacterium]|nr:LLM class flavin-dependent oxidoreductase [Acidimicrobiales bacterium]
MFQLRFDLRVPPFSTVTHAEQYRVMLEMCRWADTRGFAGVVLSEHHGTEDGFMNAPLAISAAVLGATQHVRCSISALLVPYHDPLRLAEDIATIDLLAPGRLAVIAGLGYRESEFEMFGKDRTRRGQLSEDAIRTMLTAWKGEPFEYNGRTAWVTPKPVTQPHPLIMVGGSAPVSARRAARLHLPFLPMIGDPALAEVYRAEAKAVGYTDPFVSLPEGPGLVLVTEDPDASWARIGEHLLYDAQAYASWQYPDQRSGWHVPADTVEGVRASGQYEILTPEQCVDLVHRQQHATLHPLVAGIDPAIGWET